MSWPHYVELNAMENSNQPQLEKGKHRHHLGLTMASESYGRWSSVDFRERADSKSVENLQEGCLVCRQAELQRIWWSSPKKETSFEGWIRYFRRFFIGKESSGEEVEELDEGWLAQYSKKPWESSALNTFIPSFNGSMRKELSARVWFNEEIWCWFPSIQIEEGEQES